MNPLTQIKNTQKVNLSEVRQGLSDSASWHAKFANSAYVFAGGLSFDLTEGDVLAVFSQYGEIVDVNLVRHEETGKSRGFAFVCYEDQRSTVLVVDNLNGGTVLGRTIRVEHVDDYRQRRSERTGGADAGWRILKTEITATSAGDHGRWWKNQWLGRVPIARWTYRRATARGNQRRGKVHRLRREPWTRTTP